MTENMKMNAESGNEVVYKVVLEISVVGNSNKVTFAIKNYPEDFEEQIDVDGSVELPLSYEIMQQVMNFITNEVGKDRLSTFSPLNYRFN